MAEIVNFQELYSFRFFSENLCDEQSVIGAFQKYLEYIRRQIGFLETFKGLLEGKVPMEELQKMQLKGIPLIDEGFSETKSKADQIAKVSFVIEQYLAIYRLYENLPNAKTTNDLPFWPGFWDKIRPIFLRNFLGITLDRGIPLHYIIIDQCLPYTSLNPEEYILYRIMIVWKLFQKL